jgi:hypothetical protein
MMEKAPRLVHQRMPGASQANGVLSGALQGADGFYQGMFKSITSVANIDSHS